MPSEGGHWSLGRFFQRVVLRRRDDAEPGFPSLSFEEVEKVLGLYVAGLMGQELTVREVEDRRSQWAYTDTRTIFLPGKLAEFPEISDNFSLYKVMAAHKCAQIQYGSFSTDGYFRSFSDQNLFLDIFALVENERVEYLLSNEFKGLRDELALAKSDAWQKRPDFKGFSKKTAVLEAVTQKLLGDDLKPGLREELRQVADSAAGLAKDIRKTGTAVADSLEMAKELYARLSALSGPYIKIPAIHYRGEMRFDLIGSIYDQMIHKEGPREVGRRSEVETLGRQQQGERTKMMDSMDISPKRVAVRNIVPGGGTIAAENLDNVIWLDVDPPERASEVSLTEAEKEGATLYGEWNHRWSAYRKEWCALRERLMHEGNVAYIEKVLKKHRGMVHQIRKQFEALRPELRKLKKQSDGEEIDVDAAVESLIDQRVGNIANENVYMSRLGNKRDIAVAFLVDLSGSVGGWIPEGRIIEIEKESLILICEALQILNDKYAIFGFSSSTRKQCDFHIIKGFAEAYDDKVRSRIAGMQPFNYTRMGVAVRHLSHYLVETDAKIKLMILISDGKPNDFDGYSGRYGVEDTRMALLEARQSSIRTFCITIDTEARTYVPEMFGEGNYIIIDNVGHLPSRLPEMYRRLTS